jgi:hypothetical protein
MLKIIISVIFICSTAIGFSQEAVFHVKKKTYKFPKTNEGEIITHYYRVRNNGDKPLVFSDYEVECSCTDIKLPLSPIPPNGEDTIFLTFNTEGRPYLQDRKIILHTNTNKQIEILRFKVFVKPKKQD